MDNLIPKVSVCMITYNHELYISQAIEGILMQKTNFKIELLIGEDCSKDNTRVIVKEFETKFPDIIVAQYPESNLGMMNNLFSVLKSAHGKYIALCEGDDYWTDPYKLQKQVDFLEANEKVVACFHEFQVLDQKSGILKTRNKSVKYSSETEGEGYYFDSLYEDIWLTQTLSSLFRKRTYDSINFPPYRYFNDNHLFYHILKSGKGYFFNNSMGVYRHHENGIYSLTSMKNKKDRQYFINKEIAQFNKDDKVCKRYFEKVAGDRIANILTNKINSDLSIRQILSESLSISLQSFFNIIIRAVYYIVAKVTRKIMHRTLL